MRGSVTHRVANVHFQSRPYDLTIYKCGESEYLSVTSLCGVFSSSFRNFVETRGEITFSSVIRAYQIAQERRKAVQTDFVQVASVVKYLTVELNWKAERAECWLAPAELSPEELESIVIDRLIDYWEPIVIASLKRSLE